MIRVGGVEPENLIDLYPLELVLRMEVSGC
jgi:hypothetical protein